MISEGEGQIKITPWLLIWVPALCGFYYLQMLMVRNEESCGQYTECEMLMGMLLVWETQQESQYARDWSETGALDSAFTGMPVVNKVNKESHHLERREIRRGFPSGASGREPACQCRRCSIPGLGRSRGRGHNNPLQYSCLENSMDRGTWWVTVHGVAKSRTWLKWLSMPASIRSPRIASCDSSTLSG